MDKKIIFLDCDGTIFDAPRGMLEASKKTRYAISELIKNGHYVFIATGRNKAMLPPEVTSLNPTGFITTNGAYAYMGDTVIFDEPMKQETIDQVIEYFDSHEGVYFLEDQDIVYTLNKQDLLYRDFVDEWGISHDLFSDDPVSGKCYLMMTAFYNQKQCNEFGLSLSGVCDVRLQYGYPSFDVSEIGMDKGVAVKKVLEHLHIDRKDAYAFGDGLNDAEMLLSVEESYAMANGNVKVIELAKHIAPDVLDDGFYEIMVSDGLIKAIE